MVRKTRTVRSPEVTRTTPNNAQPKGRTTRPQEYGAKERSTRPGQCAAEERSAKPEQCGAEEDSQYPSSAELRHNPRNPSSAHRGDQWHTVGTGAGPFPLLSDPAPVCQPRILQPRSVSSGLPAPDALNHVPGALNHVGFDCPDRPTPEDTERTGRRAQSP